MIKGNLTERQNYEEYIRSHKDNIGYPFWNIYWESRKLIRYFFIKKTKEKREFELQEIRLINLMSLTYAVTRIGGLIYTWYWNESLPNILLNVPNSKPNWAVSIEEIAEVFIEIPFKTVESVLLKAKTPYNTISEIYDAYSNRDIKAFSDHLSTVPIDEIFTSYTIIQASWRTWNVLSEKEFDVDKFEKTLRYELVDTYEIFNLNREGDIHPVSIVDKIYSTSEQLSTIEEEELPQDPRRIIFALCIAMKLAHRIFEYWLGESDPISETMGLILNEPIVQDIYNMYVQFPRDKEEAERIVIQCIKTLNHIFDDEIPEDIFDEEIDYTQNEGSEETMLQPVDYREYFVSKAPNIDYKTMRDIAVRLSGKVNKDKGLVDTGMAYIKIEDVTRLCYFFLHDIGKDDRDRNIDFTKPIWWIGDKWSLRYFITQLYKTGKLPSNLAKAVVEVFRFSDVERKHNEEKGKIAASSFQDTKKYLINLRHEDVERINHIMKEFGL